MKDRVRKNTSSSINQRMDEDIRRSIEHFSSLDAAAISKRIAELDAEWDTERVLEVNMPIVALVGISLGIFINSWWFIFPVLVLLFFLQHAIQGWCPPLPIFRRLGYRTKNEIHREKYALKFLRGDFQLAGTTSQPDAYQLYQAVTKS